MAIVGLDIGDKSFRAVELEVQKGNYNILNFGQFENSQLDRSKISSTKELYKSALKSFFSEFGFSTAGVIVGLSDANVFMRVLTLPKMNDSDLKKTIDFESQQYIPIPINQVNITYQKLDFDNVEKGKMQVQIVAAKIDKLKDYVEILRGANLIPLAIEPETYSISRAISNVQDDYANIIVCIGFSTTLVIVVHKGIVFFTRTIPVGGDIITKALQQKLDIEYPQAEEYKRAYGLDKSHFDGKIYEIIKPVVDNIVYEIKRAILFFSKDNSNIKIKRAIITGGSVKLPDLLIYLVNTLGIEVVIGDCLKNMTFSPKIQNIKNMILDNQNQYSTAVGLAMKGIY